MRGLTALLLAGLLAPRAAAQTTTPSPQLPSSLAPSYVPIPAAARPDLASGLSCPRDEYFDRFTRAMGDLSGHGPPGEPADTASLETRLHRMYEAQCLKDETMGESVARVWRPGRLVIHYNGSFHSDFRMGTAARARRRSKGATMLVVTAMPVGNLDQVNPSKEDRKRADYLLYVLGPLKRDSTGR